MKEESLEDFLSFMAILPFLRFWEYSWIANLLNMKFPKYFDFRMLQRTFFDRSFIFDAAYSKIYVLGVFSQLFSKIRKLKKN